MTLDELIEEIVRKKMADSLTGHRDNVKLYNAILAYLEELKELKNRGNNLP